MLAPVGVGDAQNRPFTRCAAEGGPLAGHVDHPYGSVVGYVTEFSHPFLQRQFLVCLYLLGGFIVQVVERPHGAHYIPALRGGWCFWRAGGGGTLTRRPSSPPSPSEGRGFRGTCGLLTKQLFLCHLEQNGRRSCIKLRTLLDSSQDLMPLPFKSLRSAALMVVLLPVLAATLQTPADKQGTPPAGTPPGSQQTPPGNPPAGSQTPPKGSPGTTQTPPAAGTKTQTTVTAVQATHPGGGTPVEVGDAWDSLKLDPKVRIKLSFRNAHIDNIIEMLQKASHITIVKDPALNGPMTVTTADPVGLSEAFHVFNSVLKLKGYEMTRDRKILVITVLKKPPPQPPQLPMVMPMVAPPAGPDANAEIVKFYPLMYANASQVARAINEVFLAGAPQSNSSNSSEWFLEEEDSRANRHLLGQPFASPTKISATQSS